MMILIYQPTTFRSICGYAPFDKVMSWREGRLQFNSKLTKMTSLYSNSRLLWKYFSAFYFVEKVFVSAHIRQHIHRYRYRSVINQYGGL